MSLKPSGQLSLADLSANKRKCKHTFFEQMNKLGNWEQVQKQLRTYYPQGLCLTGRQAYEPLLLCKMLLLQNWYGLSAYPTIPEGLKEIARKVKHGTLVTKEEMAYMEGCREFRKNHFTLYETIPPCK